MSSTDWGLWRMRRWGFFDQKDRALRVSVSGPVGCGKTSLVEKLGWALKEEFSLAVVTNGLVSTVDAKKLRETGVLPKERITGIETGVTPRGQTRDSTVLNLGVAAQLERRFPDLDIILIEGGADNRTGMVSPRLVDLSIYMIDTGQGEHTPRQGGPGVCTSDLLIINKLDLAHRVGASLAGMARDARQMRGDRPFLFTNLFGGTGAAGAGEVAAWLRRQYVTKRWHNDLTAATDSSHPATTGASRGIHDSPLSPGQTDAICVPPWAD
ncbi:urease accessory protein UreG [Alicyclobacillaceae bacterium I2511]|nr:urease accessory protein UreG [Alicyclobacillaceae bacterium I2511]